MTDGGKHYPLASILRTVLLQNCTIAELYYCRTVLLQNCTIAELYYCRTANTTVFLPYL